MDDPIVIANPRRGREGWILELTCPHCGEPHQHGGGNGVVAAGGHRIAHCRHLRRRGYFIALDTNQQGEAPCTA